MTGMTGYAYTEFQSEERSGSVEIKGYNNRYLDVAVNLPGRLSPLEPGIRELVSQGINRGRVEVSVRVRELAGSAEITIDKTLARTYVAGLKELAHTAGIDDTVTLSDVLSLEGVLSIDRSVDHDEYAAFLMPHLQNAFEVFCEARQAEGAAVARMVELQLQAIDALVSSLIEHAARLEAHITTTIRARFEEVVPDAVDDSRILGETAVLLVKYSIQEELDRLRFHLDSCRKLLSEPGAVGKKLDFLCQEIGREINTIGSKSIIPEINSCVVDAKNALENIREQLRNVE
ncbi:MAG: YicC family protein [Spirochaetaceae bacterium]|nr:MAG: YicC family protein [Spirochaetaceae bacterium]